MAKSFQLKRFAIWFCAFFSWSLVVDAAEKDRFVTGIEAIPFEALKYILIIVAISGSAATLTKLTKENAPIIKNLPLEIVKDAVTSFAAGVFAFLVTSWLDTEPFWLQASIIFMAGYGGSRLLEAVYADGFTTVLKNFINRMLGKSMVEPPSPPAVKEETPQ